METNFSGFFVIFSHFSLIPIRHTFLLRKQAASTHKKLKIILHEIYTDIQIYTQSNCIYLLYEILKMEWNGVVLFRKIWLMFFFFTSISYTRAFLFRKSSLIGTIVKSCLVIFVLMFKYGFIKIFNFTHLCTLENILFCFLENFEKKNKFIGTFHWKPFKCWWKLWLRNGRI